MDSHHWCGRPRFGDAAVPGFHSHLAGVVWQRFRRPQSSFRQVPDAGAAEQPVPVRVARHAAPPSSLPAPSPTRDRLTSL